VSGGFIVETVGLTFVEWRNSKRLQAPAAVPVESYEEARHRAFGPGQAQRLGAVRFDGVLQITHVDQFRSAVLNGIGPAKAFGFGLLSIAPANSV
jgi:CRISPR system Cascade subunit CasE